MPIKKTFLPSLDAVYSRWCGSIDAEDVMETQRRYMASQDYSPDRTLVVDLSCVEQLSVDIEAMVAFLSLLRCPPSKTAPDSTRLPKALALAPTDEGYGLTRQFQALAERRVGMCVTVFREEEELMTALGLPGQHLADFVSDGEALCAVD